MRLKLFSNIRERGVALGPITRNHVITTHARRADDAPFAMPTDNTTRQAMALDALISEMSADRGGSNGQHIASIQMETNGV